MLKKIAVFEYKWRKSHWFLKFGIYFLLIRMNSFEQKLRLIMNEANWMFVARSELHHAFVKMGYATTVKPLWIYVDYLQRTVPKADPSQKMLYTGNNNHYNNWKQDPSQLPRILSKWVMQPTFEFMLITSRGRSQKQFHPKKW